MPSCLIFHETNEVPSRIQYVVKEQPDGLDIYDENGFYCELTGMTLHDFVDEGGNISDEKLLDAINEEMEAEWDDDWDY